MDTALLSALSAVLGSLVGGSASVATTWMAQKTLNRREVLREELRKREALYGEFIGECAKLFMDAFTHNLEKPESLLPVFALINRVRLCASREVLAEAERVLTDPLRDFGEACRAELKSLRGGM
jgi:hypothetical protein